MDIPDAIIQNTESLISDLRSRIKELERVTEITEEALGEIKEYAVIIPLHTEQPNVLYFVDRIEGWCNEALNERS